MIQKTKVSPAVAGWGVPDIQTAYNLPSSTKGQGVIVAVVDAFDNPNVASDLAVYRSFFGLPAANFHKYNQNGKEGKYPRGDPGWGGEIDLDVQMVSAACPNCSIYLIEAKTNSSKNLYQAEKTAVALGATIVTNSWGRRRQSVARRVRHAGDRVSRECRDSGYGCRIPPTSRPWSQSAERSFRRTARRTASARGPTQAPAAPSWRNRRGSTTPIARSAPETTSRQLRSASRSTTRTRPADGAPSAARAFRRVIAGVYGLANNSAKQYGGRNFWKLSKKQLAKSLHAITTGGVTHCPPATLTSYICVAGTGQFGQYSGPSGWGTPNGIGAF